MILKHHALNKTLSKRRKCCQNSAPSDEGLADEELIDDLLINEAVRRIADIDSRSSITSFAPSNRNSLASRLSFGGGRSHNASTRLSILSFNGFNLETDADCILDVLDKEVDVFAEHDGDFDEFGKFDEEYHHVNGCGISLAPHHRTELTLREWIKQTKSTTESNPAGYFLLALPVALKLTDYIIETEPPLTSITVENIVITKVGAEGGTTETIDNVQIKDNNANATIDINNNHLVSGGVMDKKLRNLGLIFYVLFSGCDEALLMESTNKEMDAKHWHLDLMNLSLKSDDSRLKKRSSNYLLTADMRYVVMLESLGVPYSLTSMVKALLDCGQNNCGDDIFQSFYQVKIDLELIPHAFS